MSTTIVTPEVFIPEHFASCTETAIGRRVKALAVENGTLVRISLWEIMGSNLDAHRGECGCFSMQLRAVEADLTVARKAQKAGRDKTAVIAELTARRDALREVSK